jgi:hypothetical protein
MHKPSELQADDPRVLMLAPGNYYPKEHQRHSDLAAKYPKVAVEGTGPRVVTLNRLIAFPCPEGTRSHAIFL